MALLGGVLTGIVVIAIVYKVVQWRRCKVPPGPRPWPVVGNLLQIKPVSFRCFWEWSRKYGPMISVWFGSTLNVVVSSAELAKEVLKENDQDLADRPRSTLTSKFSRNGEDLIWADYGPHYVKVRKLCTVELFSPKRLEALRPIREDEVVAMVESIFNVCGKQGGGIGQSVELKKYLSAVAFNHITRVVFGKRFINEEGKIDPQGVEFKEIRATGMKLGDIPTVALHIPYLRWMFPLEERAFVRHSARRDKLTETILEEHRLSMQKSGAKQHFVDALLSLQEKYDLREDNIIGLLWDMIAAGMDTTSISVEWAMAELVRNPRVQEKAQEELDRVIGKDRVMSEADFPRLPYLQCITKEALRLHPPTPLMLPHKATQNVKVGGFDIPKGSNVHVNVWAIGRDPAVWNDPMAFRPERFMEEDIDIKGHDYRVLPFGSGRRVCPGAQLGINLVQSMLGHLLHHFVWAPPEGMKAHEIDLTETPGLVTFMAKPLEAIAISRLPPHLYKRRSLS